MQGGGVTKVSPLFGGGGSRKFLGIERGFDPPPPRYINNEHSLNITSVKKRCRKWSRGPSVFWALSTMKPPKYNEAARPFTAPFVNDH